MADHPVARLQQVLDRAAVTGRPRARTPLGSGGAYLVELDSGRRLVVRLDRDLERARAERRVISACVAAGVPVAEPPAVVSVDDGAATVQEHVEGLALSSAWEQADPDSAARDALLRATGAALRALHAVPVEGFGPLDARGHGRSDDWAEEMLGGLDERELDRAGLLTHAEHREAVRALGALRPLFASTTARLCHGDFKPEHVIVRDGQVRALVDLEHSQAGDPLLDLANWDLFHGATHPTQALLAGYGPVEGDEPALRFRAYRLSIALGHVALHQAVGGAGDVSALEHAISTDLAALESFARHGA